MSSAIVEDEQMAEGARTCPVEIAKVSLSWVVLLYLHLTHQRRSVLLQQWRAVHMRIQERTVTTGHDR